MSLQNAEARLKKNAFYVLGLRPDATRMEIEREGQKLLGMLELGLSSAKVYETPVGQGERDADMVRSAMAELHDPKRRLLHELWARLEPDSTIELGDPEETTEDHARFSAPWHNALRALGWDR